MRKFILFLIISLCFGEGNAFGQKRRSKAKAVAVKQLTPEEIAAQEEAKRREELTLELLENVRKITFIDSLVVDKDNFLGQLRLTKEAGQFQSPERLFAETEHPETGAAAYVNPMASAVYFSALDSVGHLSLHASYRTANQWSTPHQLQGLEDFSYTDFPFLCSDGVTLYFAARSEENIGGLDLYVTRYNTETRQYVRAENLGFPFNSFDNDYLLAIDESTGIGVLVTDRRQPDDKVCLYWFDAADLENGETYPFDGDPSTGSGQADDDDADAAALDLLKGKAEIRSIADTQSDAGRVETLRNAWNQALLEKTGTTVKKRFVINDKTVYTDLSQFKVAAARALAAKWAENEESLAGLQSELAKLRKDFSTTRSEKTGSRIVTLETQIKQLRMQTKSLEKQFRAVELRK